MKISNIALDIIELLLKERKENYLREIARKTKKSSSSISRQLNLLKNNKIIKEKKQGKELMYSLNFENNICLKLCELTKAIKFQRFYEKNKKIKIILEDFLNKIKNENLISAIVFGSVAKENFTKESDIDILVITSKKEDYTQLIRKIYREYNKTLTIINLTKKELKEKKQEDLIQQIIKDHLVLFGYEYFIKEFVI